MFEKVFKLSENNTSVKTEVVAGLTTFMTMAYIIALNPNLLTNFDTGSALWNGVFMATCVASAIGMFCMAFLANKPFCLAPGMGLNSFFAVVVATPCTGPFMGTALGYALVSDTLNYFAIFLSFSETIVFNSPY